MNIVCRFGKQARITMYVSTALLGTSGNTQFYFEIGLPSGIAVYYEVPEEITKISAPILYVLKKF